MRRLFPALIVGCVALLAQTPFSVQLPPRAPATPQRPARDNPIRSTAPPPPSATGAIRGRILGESSGGVEPRPLAKARVILAGPTARDPIFSDAEGRFQFSGLFPGSYVVTAEKTSYVRTRYGARGVLDPGIELEVSSGTVIEPVDLVMPKGAAISGRILDPLGDPVVGGEITVNAVQMIGSEPRLVPVSRPVAETNDRGEYRVGDLPAGRYIVAVGSGPLGSLPSGMPREWERLTAWGRTFYPGVSGVLAATAVLLRDGEDRGGVDFSAGPGGGSTQRLNLQISGISPTGSAQQIVGISGPSPGGLFIGDGSPAGLLLRFFPADPSLVGAANPGPTINLGLNANSFNQTMNLRLDPGEWIAVGRQGPNGAIVHFTVPESIGTIPTDVPIAMNVAAGSRISGRVIFEGAKAAPPVSSVMVDVRGAGPDAGLPLRSLSQGPGRPAADGSFQITGAFGTIGFVFTLPDGWIVKTVLNGTRDLLDEPLALRAGEDVTDLQVILTDQVATLLGSTIDVRGRAVSGCAVAIFPDTQPFHYNARRMRLKRSNQAGEYTIADLPSGHYFLVAAPDIDASIWLTQDGLDNLRPHAIPVTLGDRERKTISLPCVP